MANYMERRFNGRSLRKFRAEYKLSQTDVARALNMAPQSYYKYESDKVVPSVDVIMKLADTYGVSTDYLLGRSDMPQPTNFDEREVRAAFEFRDKWQAAFQLLPNMAGQTGTAGAIAQ